MPVITSTGSCFREAAGPDSIFVDPGGEEELASKIKSRALNRFYLAFLSSFALRFIDCSEPPTDAWSLLESGEAFSCAIADGLLAVEYPESLIANMPHLLGLIASFEPESP